MKPSELVYITQDIIDKGGINVTSPEMMDEAQHYNMDAVTNAATKRRTDVITGIWYVLTMPFAVLMLCMRLMGQTIADFSMSRIGEFGAITTWAMLGAMILGIAAYLGLVGYYIIFRFQREPKLVFLCSVPLILALFSFVGIGIIVINVIMSLWYTKTDEKLSQEAGYPAFVRLQVTTMESEAKSIHDMTYESIKERTKHLRANDEEFL